MSGNQHKRKKYFSSNLMMKKRRDLCLQPGLKGFISTTNGNEKYCIRESYNILNEYADKIYGLEKEEKKVEAKPEAKNEEKDIMDEFKEEIESMQGISSKPGGRRFQAIDTGVFNCLFIKTNLDDPVSLMDTIVKDLFETKSKKTRFLLRMIPIEVTCKAYEDEIRKAAVPLLDKHFSNEPATFCIVFNRRNNSNVDRDTVIKELAQLVSDRNAEHKVNLTSPTLTVIVEIMKNICGLAVVRDYFKFSKYNLNNISDQSAANHEDQVVLKDKSEAAEKTQSSSDAREEISTSDITGLKLEETSNSNDANCKGEPAAE